VIESLHIEDLGVIEEADLPLSRGLTALTGETGAGKTMVLTSLGLLLGQRAETTIVRTGAERSLVEGAFLVDPDSRVAARVVDRLEAVGLVDDQAYADALVRSRFLGTGASGRALREVLVRKGLDSSTIERALSQIDRDDEAERAAQLVARKRRSLAGVPRETAYRRLSSMLARKGYSPSVASAAVRDVLDSWGDEDSGTEEAWQWGL